jgi:hypothetical protein
MGGGDEDWGFLCGHFISLTVYAHAGLKSFVI